MWPGFFFGKESIMRIYFQASLATIFVGILIFGGFWLWRSSSFPKEKAQSISLVDELEQKGMRDFNFTTIDGQPLSLKAFAGKIIILNFWASWCGPCVEEIPSLIKLVREFKGEVVLVAVSGDSSLEDITDFLKAFPEINAPDIYVLWDKDRSITKSYEVQRLPESFLASPNFKLNKKIVGTIDWHTEDSVSYMRALLGKSEK